MSTPTPEQLAQPKRYFMRATRIAEVVGDEKCDCDTPCQCVVYATDYDSLRALVDSQSAEIARLQKDAARYRHIADDSGNMHRYLRYYWTALSPDRLDADIDADIANAALRSAP